jgi:beta-1,2-mannobiose phosphorylase / 1,2-beta-oligomannan phosphorylase
MGKAGEAGEFRARRLELTVRPDPVRPDEARGVLNPGAARDRDGTLMLFPRAVDQRYRSRVIRARVRFDERGDPVAAERLGVALESQEPYELRPEDGSGGCEDPRITYVAALDRYVMAYRAWGMQGARIALAASADLHNWQRLGLVGFEPHIDPVYRVNFDDYYNKDGVLFPEPVTAPDGTPALALLHRPIYGDHIPDGITDPRPAIWISYCPLDEAQRDLTALRCMRQHKVLLEPRYEWEELYIGAGTPPVRTALGWLLVYHGVRGRPVPDGDPRKPLRYSAGVLVLDAEDPRIVHYRSPQPILQPERPEELGAEVAGGVIFPTGIDDRGDGRLDLYYGMADLGIGAARLSVPDRLP